MNPDHQKLVREQLDITLKRFSDLLSVNPPRKGWIRAIRDALGLSTRQLGERLGVSKSRITRIEQDEVADNVTFKTMRRMAEALDCEFVYGLVPRKSLEGTLKAQALRVAGKRISRVSHTMTLEEQGLSAEEQKNVLEAAAEELIRNNPKSLWEVEP